MLETWGSRHRRLFLLFDLGAANDTIQEDQQKKAYVWGYKNIGFILLCVYSNARCFP